MKRQIAIGEQDFEKIRKNHIFYIDKTDFISEWWDGMDSVTLITRPRRFGKTLNMSMLNCFFSTKYTGRAELFDGLKIWERDDYRSIQGTYPVIFMSFAGVKDGSYENCVKRIKSIIERAFRDHEYLAESNKLNDKDKSFFNH